MKLTTKLTLLFLLLSIIPLAVVGYLAYDNGRQTIEKNMLNHLMSTTILKEAELNQWIEDNERSLRGLARRPLIREYAALFVIHKPVAPEYQTAHKNIIEEHFNPTLEEESFLELFLLRASDGLIVASTNEKHERQYRENASYFVNGKSRTYVKNVYYSLTLEDVAMTIATPIKDRDGNLVAVLAGRVDLTEMSDIMRQGRDLSSSEETYLVNKFNFFITESRFAPGYPLKKTIYTEGVKDCLQGNNGTGFYDDYRGMPIVGAYHWMPKRELCIITEVDQAEAFAPIIALRNIVLVLSVTIAVIVSLLGVLFARSITQSVHQLVKGVEEFGRGDLEYRVKVKGRDEISHLATAFNVMAAEREQAEKELREYRDHLEELVEERTAELTKANEELQQEIAERKRAEEMLQTLAETTAGTIGQDFFDRIVFRLCEWLDVDCAIIGQIVEDNRVKALSMQLDGKIIPDYAYDLAGTPCENVAEEGYCTYPEGVSQLFPEDENLVELKAEGYIGVPLRDKNGKPIGILCAISRQKLTLPSRIYEFMSIIAARASAEIERKQIEEALSWESRVNVSIAELSRALIMSASIDDISFLVLEHARRLTGSTFGYIGYIDTQTGYLVSPTITRDIWDICQVEDKDVVFKEFNGLWGWVLENRKPLLTNTPAEDPRSSGIPQGHIPIRRFLSAPALIGETLVGQVALANSDSEYTEKDLVLVERLASLYALAIQRKQAEEQIKAALAEKEVLLREVHHRVKNNLQALIYLIDMQAETIKDQKVLQALLDLQGRIRAMSLIHEKLYQAGDLAQINFGEYLEDLTSNLLYALGGGRSISLQVDAASLFINVNMGIPCGMIVNELVTNALKYAFPTDDVGAVGRDEDRPLRPHPEIRVEFGMKDGEYVLMVSDNGVGIPPELDWRTTKSLGLKLVNLWAEHQLGGSIEVDIQHGTAFTIKFTDRKGGG